MFCCIFCFTGLSGNRKENKTLRHNRLMRENFAYIALCIIPTVCGLFEDITDLA